MRPWTRRLEPGWIDRGRIIRCAMQDLLAYNEMDAWMDDFYPSEARAVWASAIATWPGAEQARERYFARALRKNHRSLADWENLLALVLAVVSGLLVVDEFGTPPVLRLAINGPITLHRWHVASRGNAHG